MKRILSLLFVATLASTICAQPGRGQGQRPDGDRNTRIVPPSLRVGLLETLGRIGTNEAEAVLVKTLKFTGSGVEVSRIDQILTDIAKGEHLYKNEVLGAAKALILDPAPAPEAEADTRSPLQRLADRFR